MDPNIKKDAWTPEEEVSLIEAHRIHGNKWAEIAKCLPGRYNTIANFISSITHYTITHYKSDFSLKGFCFAGQTMLSRIIGIVL